MIQVIKGTIEDPRDDRTGEKIADILIGRFVSVNRLPDRVKKILKVI